MRSCVILLAASLAAAAGQTTPETQTALTIYKQADYKRAIPLLQAEASHSPKDVAIQSALLSALVYEGRLDEATAAAEAGERDFSDAPEMLTARGEYEFYIADIFAADRLFRKALHMREVARVQYDLARIERLASNFRTARLLCYRAHELDPDDALITQMFLGYVPQEKREPQLSQFVMSHPWLFPDGTARLDTAQAVERELTGFPPFEPAGERKEQTLKLVPLTSGPNRQYGVGLELKLNDGRSVLLLLDTGATGILLTQKAVDKAGLQHVGSFNSWGVGDAGSRGTFMAVADSCDIQGLRFKRCVVSALANSRHVTPDEDGLIGADVFSDYLVQLDFQRHLMHLTPLPERERNPQGYNRTIPTNEKDFTPVLRQGNHLFIPTQLNDSNWGLFLIDTGAQLSNIDATFARMSTHVSGNPFTRVYGISGAVKNVFEADKAVLQFAHYRQDNLGLIAFDLNNRPEHQEFRMSGILGMPVLSLFNLSLDYRNGLVRFEYFRGEKTLPTIKH